MSDTDVIRWLLEAATPSIRYQTLIDLLQAPREDLLFTLRVLGELDCLHHPGAQAALDWLEAQRRPNGRWSGSSPYGGRTWPEIGGAVETRRWVTLQALRVLRQAGRGSAA